MGMNSKGRGIIQKMLQSVLSVALHVFKKNQSYMSTNRCNDFYLEVIHDIIGATQSGVRSAARASPA